jgi:hypothetical protein
VLATIVSLAGLQQTALSDWVNFIKDEVLNVAG